MNLTELIRTRRSVRTFDSRPLSPEDREKIASHVKSIRNPYNIPVEFVLLDADEHGLSSPVITGATLYIAGKIADVPHSEEAFGYSFEDMVIYAWSLGVGTTWIAGTLDRAIFDKAAGTKDGEIMYCVSPLGYPAEKLSDMEAKFRVMLHADERKTEEELFFDKNFGTPLGHVDGKIAEALEAVRWSPSATNRQPCRIIRDGNAFHFFEVRAKELAGHGAWDVQKIDMGIALQHFMSIAGGTLTVSKPGMSLPDNTEYTATVTL